MLKKSRICICALAAVICVGGINTACFAYSKQVGSNGVYISGNTKCGESGRIVGVDLWAPDKSFDDLLKTDNPNDYTDIIAYRYQVESGEKGFYEDEIELNDSAKSGVYKLCISCECGESIITENVVYSNPKENELALEKLAAAKSVDELITVCKDNKYALGFDSEFELTRAAAQVLYNWVKSDEFSLSDADIKSKAIDSYNRAVIIAAVSDGKVTDLFEYDKQLGLENSRIKNFYTRKYVNTVFKTAVTDALKNNGCTTESEFFDALYREFTLATVKAPDGYLNVMDVLNEFAAEIGISRTITQNDCLRVMNNKYNSYSELKAAILTSDNNGGTSGGSGGGGGGSSRGNSTTSFGNDYTNPTDNPEPMNPDIFDDIDDVSWAKRAIVELAQLGIINGKTVNTFCPNDNITREEFVKLVVLAFVPESSRTAADVRFDDVDDDAWYASYVKIAYNNNIIKGVGDNRFGTGENITRQDAATIVYNSAISGGLMTKEELGDIAFEDAAYISDYAKEAVGALSQNRIINGVDGRNFAPLDYLTRAEAAKIIYGVYTVSE